VVLVVVLHSGVSTLADEGCETCRRTDAASTSAWITKYQKKSRCTKM